MIEVGGNVKKLFLKEGTLCYTGCSGGGGRARVVSGGGGVTVNSQSHAAWLIVAEFNECLQSSKIFESQIFGSGIRMRDNKESFTINYL